MSDESQAQPAKKSKKPILMIAVVVILEAAVIVGVMSMFGGPAEVKADSELTAKVDEAGEKIVEVPVLTDKLTNNRSGSTYIYSAEIYAQVKQKHEERVKAELAQFQNEIKAEIKAIWRTSEPHHFQEPNLENLNRKVYTLLGNRFGNDQQSGKPIVVKAVLVMDTGFRIDG